MRAVTDGARFIATNADTRYPTAEGFLPGAGSIVAALATATGVTPEVIGKPSPAMFQAILEASGVPPTEAVVIGDNPDADVAGAHRAGCAAILVLTGVADATLAAELAGERRPDAIAADPAAVLALLETSPQLMLLAARHASHARAASARSGAMATGGAKARAKPFSAIAASSSSVRPTAVGRPRHLVAERGARHGAVIGRDGHADARPMECRDRMARQVRDDPGLDVRGRAEVQGHVARAEELEERVVLDGGHAVRHAADPEIEHLADALRTRDLSRVGGQREPAVPRLVEGRGVRGRRPLGLEAGKVEPKDRRSERRRSAGELDVRGRRMRAHCRDDQADQRRGGAVRRRGAGDPGGDRLEDRRHRQPALEVQAWRPANLRVPHTVVHEVLDELAGDALERLTGLEQRDREVEVREQPRLALAVLGRDHAAARVVDIERHADRNGQLNRRLRTDRPVEMLVELRLRERPQRIGRDHRPMIGTRAAASAAVAVLGLAIILGPVAADPSIDIVAEHLVRERAAAAVSALDALRAAIQPGLEGARRAAADVVGGGEPPGTPISEAAALIAGAEESVVPARRAVARLDSARVAWHPDATVTPQPVAVGELTSIAAQLAAAGPAAEEFADLLRAGDGPARRAGRGVGRTGAR